MFLPSRFAPYLLGILGGKKKGKNWFVSHKVGQISPEGMAGIFERIYSGCAGKGYEWGETKVMKMLSYIKKNIHSYSIQDYYFFIRNKLLTQQYANS